MARELAERNKVLHKLLPLFDFVPGDVSPPPAPKHTTNKPKIPKPAGPKKIPSRYNLCINVSLTDEQKQNQCKPLAKYVPIGIHP